MVKLEDVLRDFDRRLNAIELRLSQQGTQVQSSSIHPPPLPTVDAGSAILDKPNQSTRGKFEQPIPSEISYEPTDITSNFDSSSLLAVIGIIFVILAGVFFIKITIDSGWLTPIRQVLLASGVGMAFFLAPRFFPEADREYGAFLAGAGTTILHLTWLGAYSFHHIIDSTTALVCATLIGIFSIRANFHKGNRLYLLVAMAGTYLSGPIVGYNTALLPVISIFLIIWNVSFSAAALMNSRRDILFIASYYAVFTGLLLSGQAHQYDQQKDLLILQLVQFLIFSIALMSYSLLHKNPLSKEESFAILPVLLLFYFSTGNLISSMNPVFAPWFGIAIGAVVLVLYLVAQQFMSDDLKSGPVLTAFSAIAFVHSFFFQLLDESSQPFVALMIGVAVLFIWKQSETARKLFFWPLIIFSSTFVYGAILSVISVKSTDSMCFYNWLYGLVALVGVTTFGGSPQEESESVDYIPLLLGFGHLEVMLGLYRFSHKIGWSGALFVTITWGLYAALILALAYRRQDRVLGNSALIILLAVSLKAFFYDVINTGNLIRVGCLLAEGLLLYGCGWIFKRMQSWHKS